MKYLFCQTQKMFPRCLQRIKIIKTDFLFTGILSVDQETPVITSHEKMSKIVVAHLLFIYFSLSGFYLIKVKLAKFSKPLQNLHFLGHFLFQFFFKKIQLRFFRRENTLLQTIVNLLFTDIQFKIQEWFLCICSYPSALTWLCFDRSLPQKHMLHVKITSCLPKSSTFFKLRASEKGTVINTTRYLNKNLPFFDEYLNHLRLLNALNCL